MPGTSEPKRTPARGLLDAKSERWLDANVRPLFKDAAKAERAVRRARKWMKLRAGTISTKPGVTWEAPGLTAADCAKVDKLFAESKQAKDAKTATSKLSTRRTESRRSVTA
jgi:hypothetical protein